MVELSGLHRKPVSPRIYKVTGASPGYAVLLHPSRTYRMQLCIRDGRVRLFTRRDFDWTDRYPTVTAAAAKLKVV